MDVREANVRSAVDHLMTQIFSIRYSGPYININNKSGV